MLLAEAEGGRSSERVVSSTNLSRPRHTCTHTHLFNGSFSRTIRARCRLEYGPRDATAAHCLCFSKIQIGFTYWYRLTWVVPEKRPLNGCSFYTRSNSPQHLSLFVVIETIVRHLENLVRLTQSVPCPIVTAIHLCTQTSH